jgi:hypothetical protein
MLINPLPKFEKFKELVEEVKSLLASVEFKDGVNQIGLQVKDPNNDSPDAWYESVGRIRKANTMIVEPHYKYINPNLKDGYIDQWLQSLDYRVVRLRLMLVHPRTCYSIHSDPYPRIHIPVITNPQCLMCFPDDMVMRHLPADGTSYWVDTTRKHTFINCSEESRVHLVGVVLK